jgi:broad specificity phosphatase PhoE
MATKTLHCVRHAQGFHNLHPHNEETLLDPDLTPRGKDQCQRLSDAFPYHDQVDFIIASPLRRTIQTALIGFGHHDLKIVLEPRAQETTDKAADTGSEIRRLREEFGDKLDTSRMVDEWNSNQGDWEMTPENLKRYCAEVKESIQALPKQNIVLVAHGSVRFGSPFLSCEY